MKREGDVRHENANRLQRETLPQRNTARLKEELKKMFAVFRHSGRYVHRQI
jgi:hypothetical protein